MYAHTRKRPEGTAYTVGRTLPGEEEAGRKGEAVTVHRTDEDRARVHFGRLAVRRDPVDRALKALGEAVPRLEDALGFPVSVTAQATGQGFVSVEVIMPDAHYNGQTARQVGQMLRDAARPFELLYVEVDSDAPYAE